jgi:excisionase family DNA binding protein
MKMLTAKEAAQRLGVSAALVYALCASGKIAHERHGLGRGTIRISEEALAEYRKACQVEAPRSAVAGLKHIKI